MSTNFWLHLTPHFSSVKGEDGSDTGKDYKFFNKPFGLLHWLENSDFITSYDGTKRVIERNTFVILIDPDMILFRPITIDFSNKKEVILGVAQVVGDEYIVREGFLFAQEYGFGSQWASLDLAKIAGNNSPVLHVEKSDLRKRAYGPPYIAYATDMYKIARKWTEFVPETHRQHPHLLAEMFAYCIAASHLELPHQTIRSLMISDSTSMRTEGWPLIEGIPNEEVCEVAFDVDSSKHPLPSVLHYCQRYIIGDWFFGKRRQPEDFFTCESPLLELPPTDLIQRYDYMIPPPPHKPAGEKKPLSPQQAKNTVFALCGIISTLNKAGEYFKTNHCRGVTGTRRDKTLNHWHLRD